ncbi:MAG: hypothetical protein ACREMM_11310 [Gemmatimonadales bacterium]
MLALTRTVLVLGAVVLAAAPLQAQRRSNVITAEEIERAQPHVGTAYDAVQRLRPRWLKSRELVLSGRPDDPLQAAQVHVYLNDVDAGDVDYLKTIPAERVFELRWLSGNQAASRYGPTDGPAIVVTLKR